MADDKTTKLPNNINNNIFTTIHGMTGSREYRSWSHAKARCLNSKDAAYKDYGGRGITMCHEWQNSFEAFYAHLGPCPQGMNLDRIDNSKGYEPGNVRWATHKQQSRNTRRNIIIEHDGESLTLPEWAERTGIPPATIWWRHKHGRPLFAPVQPHKTYAPRVL